jgi:solute carrier family 20 (sodium-dependent phosphate transporter)
MYLWIVVVGGCFAFFASAGIGANDAANAFATSVGSKALTIKQAVVLAAIFETAGAVLMGSHVTDTIRKGIADYKCFENDADLLMYGCMWVILAVGMWLFLASYLEMPVSTTHSCVGGMIGMTMVLKGADCVIWYKSEETFPYIGGVGGIVASWVISPVFSGLIAMFIFAVTRITVLRKDFHSKRINWAYPILIGSTMTINTFFIIYKGAKGIGLDKIPLGTAFGFAFGTGGISALITIPLVPRLKMLVENNFLRNNKAEIEMKTIEDEMKTNQIELNIKNDDELNRVVALHNDAEKFDEKTEEVFKYLQIFTAVCDAFSHGANDVANAIGPFVTIWTIYKSGGLLDKKASMDGDAYWILGFGGMGIAIGLLVYGKKITYAIGEKLVKITHSRGVAIELSSALVVITGSRLKIPLSTTHCQVGATVGVGLLEDTKKCGGVNCKVFYKTAIGWIVTCVVVGLTTALFISPGVYGPSIYNVTCPHNITM